MEVKMNQITAICFDLDGTLTDPKVGITNCIQHALKSLNQKHIPASQLTWCIGPPLLQSFKTLLEDDKMVKQALSIYRERFSKKGIYENEIYPGIKDILIELNKSNFDLFLATSKPTIYAKKILDYFELSALFKNIYGSDLDGTNADKTDLLSHILKNEHLQPSTTLMIGDRKFDIVGAANNKMRSIGVLYGYGDRKELQDAKCKIFAENPEELEIRIRNYFNY